MPKMTKTQLLYLRERLEELGRQRLKQVETSLPKPSSCRIDTVAEGLKWAKNNQSAFLRLVVATLNSTGGVTTLQDMFKQAPPAKAAAKQADKLREQNVKRLNNARKTVVDYVINTTDSLYFADSQDALAAIDQLSTMAL